MWNFTARAALFSCLDGIEDLFIDPTKWMQPQSATEDLKAKEILLGVCWICNYFVVAVLNIIKHKTQTVLNLVKYTKC